jgi:hypothetical protein
MTKYFFILLFILSSFSFGQNALWSTVQPSDTVKTKNTLKYIPYDSVTKEVLEFYELYKFYFDFTGYNKKDFVKMVVSQYKSDKKDWDWINDFDDKAVFALRAPIEGGSAILVLCIDDENIHMVMFSNVFDSGANMTYNSKIESDRNIFSKWFKTLLK